MKLLLLLGVMFLHIISFAQDKPKIGLVLSGGGSKGIAHIGVLRVLESKGIKPDYIVGTSFGALVAGFYAIGFTPDEMEEIISTRDWDYLLNDEIKRENILIGQSNKNKNSILRIPLDGIKPAFTSGLYAGQNILTFFEIITRDYNKEMNFDDFIIPFRCVATNIETGEPKVFNQGKLAQAMRASLSIPSIFEPYEIDGELYVDGGLVNNFPTDVVKEMGADIIIGVDVGAVLYKKEEINSILKILDQSSSFYNNRVSKENRKLCDIYIRPDIEGISAMEFGETHEIIKLGTDATIAKMHKIDSIFGKYNLKPIVNDSSVSKLNQPLNIGTVTVKTDIENKHHKKGAHKLVNGKLKLDVNSCLSETELSNEINRLYGSKYFNEISMTFLKEDSVYNLIIDTKEKQSNDFFIGARYDLEYGVNILLSAQFRNIMIYGSLAEISLVAGQSPQFKMRYTTDRGSSIGFGTSFVFDNFNAYTYIDGQRFSQYNYNRASWDVFIHSYIGSYNRVIIGASSSYFGLSSVQSISDIDEIADIYYSPFISYVIDTWDRAYYPKSGFKFKARGDLIIDNEIHNMPIAWARVNQVSPVSKKIKILLGGFVGFGDARLNKTLYRFQLGGMSNNRIEWYNSFPGLQFLEKGANNVWIVSIEPRYEFYKNNFISLKLASAGLDDMPDRLFTKTQYTFTGVGVKYGFYSMFGPMELSADYSFQTYYKSVFLSLGFWF